MPQSAAVRTQSAAGRRIVSLVHVETTCLCQDHASTEPAEDELALVALDGGNGESGDVAVGEPGGIREMVREITEPAAEHDEGRRTASVR